MNHSAIGIPGLALLLVSGTFASAALVGCAVTGTEENQELPVPTGEEAPVEFSQPLLIRADMTTPLKYVQHAMELCAGPNLQIKNIDVEPSTPDKPVVPRKR